jgi:hypothetical protein
MGYIPPFTGPNFNPLISRILDQAAVRSETNKIMRTIGDQLSSDPRDQAAIRSVIGGLNEAIGRYNPKLPKDKQLSLTWDASSRSISVNNSKNVSKEEMAQIIGNFSQQRLETGAPVLL